MSYRRKYEEQERREEAERLKIEEKRRRQEEKNRRRRMQMAIIQSLPDEKQGVDSPHPPYQSQPKSGSSDDDKGGWFETAIGCLAFIVLIALIGGALMFLIKNDFFSVNRTIPPN